jgi:hypothetical protein
MGCYKKTHPIKKPLIAILRGFFYDKKLVNSIFIKNTIFFKFKL